MLVDMAKAEGTDKELPDDADTDYVIPEKTGTEA
jgi:hypothetical protein